LSSLVMAVTSPGERASIAGARFAGGIAIGL
jgi:hypothetical protein